MKELEEEENLKIKAIFDLRSKNQIIDLEAIEPFINEETNGNINPSQEEKLKKIERVKQWLCSNFFFKCNCSWIFFSKFKVR